MKLTEVINYITELEIKSRENDMKIVAMENDMLRRKEGGNKKVDVITNYLIDLGAIKLSEIIYGLEGYSIRINEEVSFKDWLKEVENYNWQERVPLNIPREKLLDIAETHAYNIYKEEYEKYKEKKDV